MPRPFHRFLIPVLAAALVTAAAPAIAVGTGSAGAAPTRAAEVSRAVDRTAVFELPLAASHVAVHWAGRPEAQLTVAFSVDGTSFGSPVAVERDEMGEQRRNGETYGAVVVAGGARSVRVTSGLPLTRATVLALDASVDPATGWSLAGTAAGAVAQPTLIPRAGWGADESLRYDAAGNEIWAREFWPIQKLIVHHTATGNADPDPRATIRSIYYYHAVTQGWGDIGYNFLVDEAGNVYEGRASRTYAAGESPTGEDVNGNGVTAGHALGYNSGTVGVALLGTLTSRDATPAARDALERFLAWKADAHHLDPHGASLYTNPVNGTQQTFPNISGHRDVNSTECPGDVFYGTLPALRSAVANRISGTQATVPGAPTLSANRPTTGHGIALTWTVPPSGGSPITGYRIYRRTGSGSETLLKAVTATTTRYQDGATKRGTSYTYRVSAVNAVGEGPRSNAATATAK
ncbi:MAG: N-acetylmuramoyl-L-alanine amidase [Chloroflexota bacterium]|nr:N-acetylmuramoyl-L-alanine amidase [Chloroflexota bacterium]